MRPAWFACLALSACGAPFTAGPELELEASVDVDASPASSEDASREASLMEASQASDASAFDGRGTGRDASPLDAPSDVRPVDAGRDAPELDAGELEASSCAAPMFQCWTACPLPFVPCSSSSAGAPHCINTICCEACP